MNTQSERPIPWQGLHHVALVTKDLDQTIQFYGDVLGMQIGEIMQRQQRHCFIRPGGATWGMHFFEYPVAEIYTHPEILTERFVFLSGAMQHLAFALPDKKAANALRNRLESHNIQMTPINTLGKIRNFLFVDNNGILLEATWPNEPAD